ncbi:hypothetical protein APR41_11890 [Salegentibacter salinarum]|uniref:Peptidase M56 domain-containing protein n=1 Tax=Salegentibacter salinarum TaxID=447422 RepID=A0A2N0U279_9FLAO|nr:M56 family metallopeptidase [Salegentibacter salinarum]PKD21110.1 hypothetical protein APR41_11890 [Salegentibacter salinarum]SKB76041.1 Signal transducer regulating beta-lactamase production, contains metallopeptidase domain [Salegentibacter salinarum]
MEWYILKSVAILATLLLFYKLLLEKENMHTFKRFYLLFAIIASIGIPLITITTYVEPVSESFDPVLFQLSEETSASESNSFEDNLLFILWTIYALGVIFFSIKFIRNLRELLLKIKTNPKIKKENSTRILLQEKVDPHTFFNYIFLNRREYKEKKIPKEVIIHEEAHAKQKHSLDILIVEFLQIVFWINPLIIFLKDYIKLNHEFLADREVLKKGIQTAGYQTTLLSFSSGHLHSDLVNPINYSSIKKRFTVMKTQTSKKTIWAKSLLLLPLLGILIYSCSTKEELEKPNSDPTAQNQPLEKATPEMIREYNRLASSYNSTGDKSQEINDYDRMSDIYKVMSPEQKKTAESFPEIEIIEVVEDPKATPEMIAEYNKIIGDLNETGIIKQKDLNQINKILRLMTVEQKKSAVPSKFEILPPPPPAPPTYKKLLADGATFYYQGKIIEPQKAQELVEDQKKVNMQITYDNKKRPFVELTDKEN